MNARRHTKFVREGSYAAEVDVELIEEDNGWLPYPSLQHARKLDPASVRTVIEGLPRGCLELIHQNAESEALAEEYIRHAVVSRRMLADAQHIAVATVARVDVLVSWNFRHIVNLDRIRGFNAVNLRAGYPLLEIRSPLEVWTDDDEDL